MRLAGNQIALNAGRDEDLLQAGLRELNDRAVDLDLLDIAERELAELLGGIGAGGGGPKSDVEHAATLAGPSRGR